MKIEDGLVYKDEKSEKKIIFNYKTFYEIVVACVARYGKKTNEDAKKLVDNSFIVKEPPFTMMEVRFLVHEEEYHWAMILLYGEGYWKKIPNSYPPSDEYYEWIEAYQRENNLAEEVIE